MSKKEMFIIRNYMTLKFNYSRKISCNSVDLFDRMKSDR